MTRILIDGTTISAKMDGLSQYILNIVEQFALHHTSSAHFLLLLRQGECPESYLQTYLQAGIEIEFVDIAPIGPLRNIQFAKYLKHNKSRFDRFYEPSNQYPATLQGGIYTVHDLIYELYPEQLGRLAWLKRIILHRNVRTGLRKCKRVIAISQYTKNELLRLHKIKGLVNKIEVVYEGWEHLQKESVVCAKQNYFFYVGSSRGHKNLYRLLQAYAKIADTSSLDLVIAGNMNRMSVAEKSLIGQINSKRERVCCTGWVTNEQLAQYFSAASAFIFPSLCEGFGIPVLEAFYYKTPLICSNNTVFPEIAGDAAIYFDPYSIDDIAQKMIDFEYSDAKRRAALTTKGAEKLKVYSWRQAAAEIFDIIKQ